MTFVSTNGGPRRTVGERLMQKVEVRPGRDDCWLWKGAIASHGYGSMTDAFGKNEGPHRVSYRVFVGPITDGLHVLHRCDTPLCCRPSHLFLGTNDDNMADKVRKGRQSAHKGTKNYRAKLTEEQVLFIRSTHISPKTLAKTFGVSAGTIYHIRTGKTWRHI